MRGRRDLDQLYQLDRGISIVDFAMMDLDWHLHEPSVPTMVQPKPEGQTPPGTESVLEMMAERMTIRKVGTTKDVLP